MVPLRWWFENFQVPAGLSKDYLQDLRGKADVQAQPEKTLTLREEIGQYEAYNLTVEEAEEENPLVPRNTATSRQSDRGFSSATGTLTPKRSLLRPWRLEQAEVIGSAWQAEKQCLFIFHCCEHRCLPLGVVSLLRTSFLGDLGRKFRTWPGLQKSSSGRAGPKNSGKLPLCSPYSNAITKTNFIALL